MHSHGRMGNDAPALIDTPEENGTHRQPLQPPKKMILLSMILSKFSAVIDSRQRANHKHPAGICIISGVINQMIMNELQ